MGRLVEMMRRGELSREVMVLEDGEWMPLRDVLPPSSPAAPMANIVIDPRVRSAADLEESPAASPGGGVAPVVRFFGVVGLLAAGILLVVALALLATGDGAAGRFYGAAGLAAVFSGVMTLAAAEALDRLREIRDELRGR